jgi:hypothetical protein
MSLSGRVSGSESSGSRESEITVRFPLLPLPLDSDSTSMSAAGKARGSPVP